MHPAARHLPTLAGAALAALTGGAPAQADEFSERRATCEPMLTVVKDSCLVENLFVCPGGENYSETYWQGALVGAELYDQDHNPIHYANSDNETEIRKVLRTDRAYSLSELLLTGQTSGSFLVKSSSFLLLPIPARMTLSVQLTDELRVVDGIVFQVAQSEMRWDLGDGRTWVGHGPMLIDSERRLMLNDEGTTSVDGLNESTRDAVLNLIAPNEQGFLSTVPPGCDFPLSLAPFALGKFSHG